MADLHHPVRRLVELAAGIHIRVRRWTERRLRDHDITYPQFGALTVLYDRDRISQRELAATLQTDTTTAMVLCDALQRKGWLTRLSDPSDRRTNRLVLTGAGREALERARPGIEAGFAAVAGALTEKEAREALGVLEKLYERIRAIEQEGTTR